MLSWISAVLLIAISYGLLRFGLWVIQVRNRSHRQYVEAARGFFEHANHLLKMDNLTESDIEFIDDLASTINDKMSAPAYLRVLQKKEARRRKGIKTQSNTNLEPLSIVHTEDFSKCVYAWFSAITANSPLFGALIRITIDQQKIPATTREVSHKVNAAHKSSRSSKLAHA